MTKRRKHKHSPQVLLYCHLTRTVINAYQSGGWNDVDEILRRALKRHLRGRMDRAAWAKSAAADWFTIAPKWRTKEHLAAHIASWNDRR